MTSTDTASYGPKHPEVKVQLVGLDGNAYSIMGRAQQAMIRAGLTDADVTAYCDEAMSGDYDNLLQTTMRWFDCE
jgi:hypothetical protein